MDVDEFTARKVPFRSFAPASDLIPARIEEGGEQGQGDLEPAAGAVAAVHVSCC